MSGSTVVDGAASSLCRQPPRCSRIPHSPVAIAGAVPTPDELAAIYAAGKARRKVYKDLKILGSGSEGTVKLAMNTETGEKVAMKVMRKPHIPHGAPINSNKIVSRALGESYEQAVQAREKMEREIRKRFYAMKAHSGHPHLPRYLEMFETESKFYIVTSICPGGTLADYISSKGGVLTEDDARYATHLLLRTLAYIHACGVTHRDLKPANIFLRERGNLLSLCIADFAGAFITEGQTHVPAVGDIDPDSLGDQGTSNSSLSTLAVSDSHGTSMKTITGTPFYLAPEVVAGQPYSSKVDMWALGCITYEMLFGRTPFATSSSFSELFERIAVGKYPVPEGGSDAAKSFIAQLLEPDPERRLSAVQAMEHPWLTQVQARNRMLSGVQVFWKDEGALETVLPTGSGVGLDQLGLSDCC